MPVRDTPLYSRQEETAFTPLRLARHLAETGLNTKPPHCPVCSQAPPEPGDRPAGGKTARPRPASWLALLPAQGLGKGKRRREQYPLTPLPEGLPLSFSRKEKMALRTRRRPPAAAGVRRAEEQNPTPPVTPCPKGFRSLCPYKRPTAGPRTPRGGHRAHSPYPSPRVLTGGFVARSQPHRLRGTAPPRTGGRGRSAPFRSRPHGLGGCLKGSPAGVPPAPHRKSKPPREGVLVYP